MTNTLSRRQFLKVTTSGATCGVATMLGLASAAGAPRPSIPERVMHTLNQPAATPLPSSLPLGAPLVDVSKGWDGTLWGIDTNGVPYHFDQLSQTWDVFGNGFDVVARYDISHLLFVRGAEAVISGGAIQPLSSMWKNLPDSFAQGLDGAAVAADVLYLFRNGRYVSIDKATSTASAPLPVTSFRNWPTADHWQHGVIDAVGSHSLGVANPYIMLWSRGEYIFVDMTLKQVTDGPHDLAYFVKGEMLAAMRQGFKTMVWNYDKDLYTVQAYNGPVCWTSSNMETGDAHAEYVGTRWSSPWAPVLSHAPSGRAGALWVANKNSSAIPAYHDGRNWHARAAVPSGYFFTVSAGADDTVFGLTDHSDAKVYQIDPATNAWTQRAVAPPFAVQLSVGDADHIWARNRGEQVFRRNGGGFSQVNVGRAATHIAAGSDGTLWHASGDASVYRFIPESNQPSIPLSGLADGATIRKVAGTGFGSAYLLTDGAARLHAYDSPYVFKTSQPYFTQFERQHMNQAIAVAGHTVFLSTFDTTKDFSTTIVALDAQSGDRQWSVEITHGKDYGNNSYIVYDAALQLLYVSDGSTVRALNAATGAQVWLCDTAEIFLPGTPRTMTLSGSKLCVALTSGRCILFDTVDALADGRRNLPAYPVWVSAAPANTNVSVAGIPAFDDAGAIYVTLLSTTFRRSVLALKSDTGDTLWQRQIDENFRTLSGNVWDAVAGQTSLPTSSGDGQMVPALFVNGGDHVYALKTTDGSVISSYAVPQGTTQQTELSSGMAYRDNRLYFGDNFGKLYVLDAHTMRPVRTTTDPHQDAWQGVLSRPQLIVGKDASAGVVVAFTRGDQHMWFFDPDSGNLNQVSTDLTAPGSLVYDDAHGVLYAMGWRYTKETRNDVGQVFAVRPDSFIQDERSFIVESELMQDFANDAEAAGQGVSRYQTHVAIVDDTKAARANQSVKLWADAEDTTVSIDGIAFTIGPASPAMFTTDGSGSFTITSDADDLTTVAMRMWTPFMDGSERIAIVPDAAFHRRLAATSANGSNDPQQIDLKRAKSYDGTPLFDDPDQAQQAAAAITQMTSSVGMGGGSSTFLRGRLNTHTSDSKYIAYPDHAGIAYTPVDVVANQDVISQTPLGLRVNKQGHRELTVAEAATLIDNMRGASNPLLTSSQSWWDDGISWLEDAWEEIKETGAQVVDVVVSVAKDVYAGIVYVVDGVTKVVKAVVQDIKDAAAAIGAFFVQLGKGILKALEALSKLLHLGEVFETAKVIRNETLNMLNNLGGLLAKGKTAFDGWFMTAETEITDGFCKLYDILNLPGCSASSDSGTPFKGLNGIGETPTSIYNTGMGGDASRAVECGWSTHVLRSNLAQATPIATSRAAALGPFEGMANLINTFLESLTTDPQLRAAYESVGGSFSATFKAISPEQFFSMGLQSLLEIVKTIAITGVALAKAVMDTLLAAVNILVEGLKYLGGLHIPILSPLWHTFTGEDLTFLDLLSLVMAFPVTYMYRAIDGSYPSESQSLRASMNATDIARNVMGLASGVGTIINAVLSAVLDTAAAIDAQGKKQNVAQDQLNPISIGWKIFGLSLLVVNAGNGALNAVGKDNDYVYMYASVNVLITTIAALGIFVDSKAAAYINMVLAAVSMICSGLKYLHVEQNDLTIAREVVGAFPVVVNPIKFAGIPVGLIAPAVDLACRVAAGGIQLDQVRSSWRKLGEEEHIIYLPVVAR